MFRSTAVTRRVSAFSLYMKDLARQGKLSGTTNTAREASKTYQKLTNAQHAALQKRADKMTYPALDAYNRFQKEYAHRFTHLNNKERQRKVAALWAELKEKGTVRIPRAPKSAAKKIKKTAKEAKAVRKVRKVRKVKKAAKK